MRTRSETGLQRAWRLVSSARTRALLSVGVLLGTGSLGTLATWTDTAELAAGTITSGTMDLQLDAGGAVGTGTGHQRADISWDGLTPGERKAFDLSVHNAGDPPFTYSAAATRGASPAWTYVGTPITVQLFTGTAEPDSTYPQQDGCSGGPLGPARNVDGSSQPLLDAAMRLEAGANDQLCLVVGLAEDADNQNQGRTGSLALDFTADQAP